MNLRFIGVSIVTGSTPKIDERSGSASLYGGRDKPQEYGERVLG